MVIFTLVFLAILKAAESEPQVVIFSKNLISHAIAIAIAVVPTLMFVAFSNIIHSKNVNSVAMPVVAFAALFLFIWPGAFKFMDVALKALRLGGELPAVLYVKKEKACLFDSELIDKLPCEDDKNVDEYIKLKTQKIILITKENYFVKYKKNPQEVSINTIISIPKEDVGGMEYDVQQ
ncbi:hypothetical protein GCM10011317_26050 [Niveispirillum cyanobacteriorum]|nr:hypothetical protein GCM10011317_26050 [Niveispirillum cyanobacteriorum]